mmetsp:Transcript_28275/g.67904  ORF Transcript_28275/g.67904 Transcript_28275/m.67904 type:complete len:99 (+) Transcript_28275:45-341(+)
MGRSIVQPLRVVEGMVSAMVLVMISAVTMQSLGSLYHFVVVEQGTKLGAITMVFERAFPMSKNRWEYGLVHIILFAILIAIMSMFQPDAPKEVKSKKK